MQRLFGEADFDASFSELARSFVQFKDAEPKNARGRLGSFHEPAVLPETAECSAFAVPPVNQPSVKTVVHRELSQSGKSQRQIIGLGSVQRLRLVADSSSHSTT